MQSKVYLEGRGAISVFNLIKNYYAEGVESQRTRALK